MNYWDSYDYPEHDPKVRIIAWLGVYGKTVVPPKVNVEAEYSLDCSDELQARAVMNAHADQFIKERNLQSILLKP